LVAGMLCLMAKCCCEEKGDGELSSFANMVDSKHNDDFAKYQRQYEFHADAWLVARAHGEQGLSRRSAQQMLRALQGMYRFLQIHKR